MTKKILVVDDSTFMRLLIINLLKKAGYKNIVEAENGREALEVYETEGPDLVILDIIMPSLDGLQTLKKLMKIDKNAKVLMITAVGQEEIMKECEQVGAVGYIKKPFKEKEIIEVMMKQLGSARKSAGKK